jgi:very-short-patch-repair endonuclease
MSPGSVKLDFAFKDQLVDVEVDGERYHSSIEAADREGRKDAWL